MPWTISLIWGIILMPALGGTISLVSGKSSVRVGSAALLVALGITLGLAMAAVSLMWAGGQVQVAAAWMPDLIAGDLSLRVGFRLDLLAACMAVLVALIALLVTRYSEVYMKGDARYSSYFAYLGFFVSAMLTIVFAGDLLTLFAGWEWVGLCSYLLIGFWRNKTAAAHAAPKAFIVNRVGDAFFLAGIILAVWRSGTTDMASLLGQGQPLAFWPGLLLICGAVGKSAQFPLQVWLPDAMAGPTPVSALLHAATMVAAGVYMAARLSPVLPAEVLTVLAVIGGITALSAALMALAQTDIKRILAYSTLSQLGLMMMGIGAGVPEASVFHLFTHAFFKAGLFLVAGIIIHTLQEADTTGNLDAQDIRQMGGLRRVMPWTWRLTLLMGLSLAGMPLFSGFLSKDGILLGIVAHALQSGGIWYGLVVAAFVTTGLTGLYISRWAGYIFGGAPRSEAAAHAHDARGAMAMPVWVLGIGSIWGWFSLNPLALSEGWVSHVLGHASLHVQEWVHVAVPMVSAGLAGAGLILGWRLYGGGRQAGPVTRRWMYLDFWYEKYLAVLALSVARLVYRIDTWIVDGFVRVLSGVIVRNEGPSLAHAAAFTDMYGVDGLVNGVAKLTGRVGRWVRTLQTGRIQQYIGWSVLVILALTGWYCWTYWETIWGY
ncbi:MAG: NADH-quinone oxidoreductase subunit L [Bacteroidia bacterium]|nr:NADH-quinone oxidoreductase subunit L [Bacteroidia bacterium]